MIQAIGSFWSNFFEIRSIKHQLVIFAIITTLIPSITLFVIFNNKTNRQIENELIESYLQVQSEYVASIQYKLDRYLYGLDKLSTNTVIIDNLSDSALKGNPIYKGTLISNEVIKTQIFIDHKEVKNCIIYSVLNGNPVYGSKVTDAGLYTKLKEELMEINANNNFLVNGSNDIIHMYKSINKMDMSNFLTTELGIIKLDLIKEPLFSPSKNSYSQKYFYNVMIMDDNGNVVYNSSPEDKRFTIEGFKSDIQNGKRYKEYNDIIAVPANIKEYGIDIVVSFDVSLINQRKIEFLLSVIPAMAITLIIILFMGFSFSKKIAARVGMLVEKMRRAETGDLSVGIPIKGKDEITQLDDSFEGMLSKLDNLIKKNYIQEIENKETQLRNLQLQINPHFLYNTLEIVGSIAAINHVFEICDITEKLGAIFRYSLGKGYDEFVTVREEMHHTQNYIFIQSVRFAEKFHVYYCVEEQLEGCMIPRFILQPLVENAILHGLSASSEPGTLEISVYKEEDSIYIKIEDDGIGMSNEDVIQLNKSINESSKLNTTEKSKNAGIGVKNVNQRVKMICGQEYGVTVSTIPGKGVCSVLKLPLLKGCETK